MFPFFLCFAKNHIEFNILIFLPIFFFLPQSKLLPSALHKKKREIRLQKVFFDAWHNKEFWLDEEAYLNEKIFL
jgi:hypothetical protein